jgi:signal transduction histidine kinase/ActR/RegA family two-component response regulator
VERGVDVLTKPSILVVENDAAMVNRCSRLLLSRGYKVRTAESSKEALHFVEKYRADVDIMLLSLELPDLGAMSVIEVLHRIKSKILVMAMSVDCGEEAIEAMHAGAYDCIRKSFTNARFWTKMNRVMERFTLARHLEILKKERESVLAKDSCDEGTILTILDSMADMILVTDQKGNLILCNKPVVESGLLSGRRLGRPIAECLKNKDLVSFMMETLQSGQQGRPFGHHEVCLLETGDAKLRAHINPVINGDGVIVGSVALLHDMSQTDAMNQVKADFMSMVSHELKAPLSALLMQISVVVDGLAGDINAKQKDLLGKSKEKTKGMIALVNDLLDLRRIEEGKALMVIEPLDMGEILQRSIDLMSLSAQDENITLEVNIADDLPLLSGDRSGMQAVFVNLISNAVKYTPSGGRVTIELNKAGKALRIKVVDTGIGIEKADIEHIFDRFYRIKSEQTRSIGGSGLGLAIVKGIVDAHKGTIHLESEVGKGTMIIVSLPLEK